MDILALRERYFERASRLTRSHRSGTEDLVTFSLNLKRRNALQKAYSSSTHSDLCFLIWCDRKKMASKKWKHLRSLQTQMEQQSEYESVMRKYAPRAEPIAAAQSANTATTPIIAEKSARVSLDRGASAATLALADEMMAADLFDSGVDVPAVVAIKNEALPTQSQSGKGQKKTATKKRRSKQGAKRRKSKRKSTKKKAHFFSMMKSATRKSEHSKGSSKADHGSLCGKTSPIKKLLQTPIPLAMSQSVQSDFEFKYEY